MGVAVALRLRTCVGAPVFPSCSPLEDLACRPADNASLSANREPTPPMLMPPVAADVLIHRRLAPNIGWMSLKRARRRFVRPTSRSARTPALPPLPVTPLQFVPGAGSPGPNLLGGSVASVDAPSCALQGGINAPDDSWRGLRASLRRKTRLHNRALVWPRPAKCEHARPRVAAPSLALMARRGSTTGQPPPSRPQGSLLGDAHRRPPRRALTPP